MPAPQDNNYECDEIMNGFGASNHENLQHMIHPTSLRINCDAFFQKSTAFTYDIQTMQSVIESQTKRQQMSLFTVSVQNKINSLTIVNLGHNGEDKYGILMLINNEWEFTEVISAKKTQQKYGISQRELPPLNLNGIFQQIIDDQGEKMWFDMKQITPQNNNVEVIITIETQTFTTECKKALENEDLPYVFTNINGEGKWIKVIAISTENGVYHIGISCKCIDGTWEMSELYLDLSVISGLSAYQNTINRIHFVEHPVTKSDQLVGLQLQHEFERNQQLIGVLSAELNMYHHYNTLYDVQYEDTGLELQSDWEDEQGNE